MIPAARCALFVASLTVVPAVGVAQDSAGTGASGWASLYLQVAEGEDVLPIGVVAVDLSTWHLEGRYNYEDTETVSLWAGWNLAAEGAVTVAFTPMMAVVLGAVNGVAPGFELTLDWHALTYYNESEVVIPFNGDPSYYVGWSSLTWRVSDWLQPGVTYQRLREFEGERTVDPGLAVVSEFGAWTTGVYAYNLAEDSRFLQLTVTRSF